MLTGLSYAQKGRISTGDDLYAHQRIARQFFKAALRNEYIDQNPFEDINAGKQTNSSRIHFVDRETIEAVLEAPKHAMATCIRLCKVMVAYAYQVK